MEERFEDRFGEAHTLANDKPQLRHCQKWIDKTYDQLGQDLMPVANCVYKCKPNFAEHGIPQ